MARRLAIIAGVVVAFVLGGAGLIQLAGSGATAFRLEGPVLHLSGPLSGAAADRLERMLEENPAVEILALGEMPGADDVVWAAQMAQLIRAAGLATEARGLVANDAILLFLGGAERRLAGGALVMRSDAMQQRTGVGIDRSIAADADRRRVVATMLGDAAFADFMKETRALRDDYRLSDVDLARFGLMTMQ